MVNETVRSCAKIGWCGKYNFLFPHSGKERVIDHKDVKRWCRDYNTWLVLALNVKDELLNNDTGDTACNVQRVFKVIKIEGWFERIIKPGLPECIFHHRMRVIEASLPISHQEFMTVLLVCGNLLAWYHKTKLVDIPTGEDRYLLCRTERRKLFLFSDPEGSSHFLFESILAQGMFA